MKILETIYSVATKKHKTKQQQQQQKHNMVMQTSLQAKYQTQQAICQLRPRFFAVVVLFWVVKILAEK